MTKAPIVFWIPAVLNCRVKNQTISLRKPAMSKTCPNCNYVRLPSDTAPDWQCPACERAYNKAAGTPLDDSYGRYNAQPVRPSSSGGAFKWLLIVAVLAAGIAVFAPFGGTNHRLASLTSAQAQEQPEVVLYATDWCGYCAATRQFFAANGIRYTELDIEKSSDAAAGHRRLGGNGVPLIVVGDEIVNGYNEALLRKLLRPWLSGS